MMCKQKYLRMCFSVLLFSSSGLLAEGKVDEKDVTLSADTVHCQSSDDERQHCPANTSSGVILQNSTGSAACLLGKTWGYDDTSIWVKDGCSGDFLVGLARPAGEGGAKPDDDSLASEQEDQNAWEDSYGTYQPGRGATIFRGPGGEVSISAYALLRYINQMPDGQTFTDHLGDVHPVNARNDIYSHRVMVFLNGWVGDPKMVYNIAWWTVNTTDQDALFANLGYRFHKSFNLFAGINGNPGTRSMFGSHPYWLGTDRVMADEFFRPFFAQGLWANGEVAPGLWYSVMAGNSSSTLGVTAAQLDRKFTTGGSLWWMPTTQEFGPRGGYGDWESHQKLATRFGISTVYSPEQRYTEIGVDPGNTALKLADSLNLFSTGALAPDVTVTFADYRVISLDAGFKYKGFFFQTEFYWRWLNGFEADGTLPVDEIVDHGFYIQTAFYPVPKKIELYVATSQIYGDKDAGFSDSSEYLVGMNYYPWNTRNYRLNAQVIDVNLSPVNSTFGYYTGGQDGTTVSVAFSIFF
jgi:hypothetical protein